MTKLLIPKAKTRLLLVEGKVDQEFFIQVGKQVGANTDTWSLHIIQFGGRHKLRESLLQLANPDQMEQIQKIGIVRDADFNTNALQSVQDALRYANAHGDFNFDIPSGVLTPTSGEPSVAILILPAVEREGMLEDLIMDAFREDPVNVCVDVFFNCLRESDIAISQARLPKVRLRTFITGKNIGADAEGDDTNRQYLSDIFRMTWLPDQFWDHPAFTDAKAFLTQLLAD